MDEAKRNRRTDAYRERDAKFYDFRKLKVRKEWCYSKYIKQAADVAGESINSFIVRASVERARSLGVPFENGPFFDEEPSDTTSDTSEPETTDE